LPFHFPFTNLRCHRVFFFFPLIDLSLLFLKLLFINSPPLPKHILIHTVFLFSELYFCSTSTQPRFDIFVSADPPCHSLLARLFPCHSPDITLFLFLAPPTRCNDSGLFFFNFLHSELLFFSPRALLLGLRPFFPFYLYRCPGVSPLSPPHAVSHFYRPFCVSQAPSRSSLGIPLPFPGPPAPRLCRRPPPFHLLTMCHPLTLTLLPPLSFVLFTNVISTRKRKFDRTASPLTPSFPPFSATMKIAFFLGHPFPVTLLNFSDSPRQRKGPHATSIFPSPTSIITPLLLLYCLSFMAPRLLPSYSGS